MSYADGTSVSVERSRAELDALLSKHGASQRLIGSDDEQGFAFAVFRLAGRQVRLRVPVPKLGDYDSIIRAAPRRTIAETRHRAWEQACRERWRALVLLTKAKLEAIALGVSTVEREFLADTFLPDGRTVYEAIAADVERSYLDGKMPPLLGAG